VSRLNIGDENAHREKSRDDRAAVRWHFAGASPKRPANGRPTPGSRRRSGQSSQPGTARTGCHAGGARTECSIHGAEPLSPVGRATDRDRHDNPGCASSHEQTPQTHVHVGQKHASQDAENRAATHQTTDETVSLFFKSGSTAPERSGAFLRTPSRLKRATNAVARARRRFCRPLRSI
jgi:hypothetical protein